MTTPVNESTNVGYCPAADVYCSFSEYYGGGTTYGWRHLYIGDEVVRGAGKTKRDLIAAGAIQEEAICPAVPVDIVVLPLDLAPAPEAPAPAPEVLAPEVPAPETSKPNVEISVNKVVVKFKGFSITLNASYTKDVIVDVSDSGDITFTL